MRAIELLEDNNHYYVVSECLNGGSLKSNLKKIQGNEAAVAYVIK